MPAKTCPMSGMACPAGAAVAPPTKESQAAMTPQKALDELRAGNARFVAGHPLSAISRRTSRPPPPANILSPWS